VTDLKILTQRELREIIAPNVPFAYRPLAVAYFHDLLQFLEREKLIVVRADARTYRRLTSMSDPAIDASLLHDGQ